MTRTHGGPDVVPAGDMYDLECLLERRLQQLHAHENLQNFESFSTGDPGHPFKLVPNFDFAHNKAFFQFTRASSMLHRLRLHMASTFVIVVTGLRENGKSTIMRHVFGCDARAGAGLDDSTSDVQPFYIPVEGEGAIKHLLVLDMVGSDDTKVSSLATADATALADLLIVVGKVSRGGAQEKCRVMKDIFSDGVHVEPPIRGRGAVLSWAKSPPPLPPLTPELPEGLSALSLADQQQQQQQKESVVEEGDEDEEDEEALFNKSRCKVAYLMTHADDHLCSYARQKVQEGVPKDTLQKKAKNIARDLAGKSWAELLGELRRGDAGVDPKMWDRISCASCMCNPNDVKDDFEMSTRASAAPAPAPAPAGAQGGSARKPFYRHPALLGPAHIQDFLSRLVPPEVGATIKTRHAPLVVLEDVAFDLPPDDDDDDDEKESYVMR